MHPSNSQSCIYPSITKYLCLQGSFKQNKFTIPTHSFCWKIQIVVKPSLFELKTPPSNSLLQLLSAPREQRLLLLPPRMSQAPGTRPPHRTGYGSYSSAGGRAAPHYLSLTLRAEGCMVTCQTAARVCQRTPGHWSRCPYPRLSTHHCPPSAFLLPAPRVTPQIQAELLGLAQGHAYPVVVVRGHPTPAPPLSALTCLSGNPAALTLWAAL